MSEARCARTTGTFFRMERSFLLLRELNPTRLLSLIVKDGWNTQNESVNDTAVGAVSMSAYSTSWVR